MKLHSFFLTFAKSSVMIILLVSLSSCMLSRKIEQRGIVPNVDLERFAGKWFEIARYPHRFERDLVGVTAEYTLQENGGIQVINSGYQVNFDGNFKSVTGKAKRGDTSSSGWLKVSFFWIFYADYLILELDTINYEYALIGSTSDKYLWILNRQATMDQSILDMLCEKARERGYDLSKLEMVEQKRSN